MAVQNPGAALFGEHPCYYRPSIAKALGSINQAVVLERLYYWLQQPNVGRMYEGHKYIWNTHTQWADQLGLTERQVRRSLDDLRKAGVVISISNPHHSWDRTLWWRLDDIGLAKLLSAATSEAPSDQMVISSDQAVTSIRPNGQIEMTKRSDRSAQMGRAIPITTSKTTETGTTDTENTQKTTFDFRELTKDALDKSSDVYVSRPSQIRNRQKPVPHYVPIG